MNRIKSTLGALVAAGAVILATWTGWSCWDWHERVDRRLDELAKHLGEVEHRVYRIETGESGGPLSNQTEDLHPIP